MFAFFRLIVSKFLRLPQLPWPHPGSMSSETKSDCWDAGMSEVELS